MQLKFPNDKTKQKKTQINWGLLLLGLAGVGGYFWEKRKKEKELAQAQEQAQKESQGQPQDKLLPPVAGEIVLPVETSTEARLRGMGVNPDIPSPYQGDESYKELK